MQKHVIVSYLPYFVSKKQLSEDQMQSCENFLLSAAWDAGCLSLTGLLKPVIKSKWFPKCRS